MKIRVMFVLAALLLAGAARAGAGLDQMNAFLEGLDTLVATFDQSVLDTEGERSGLYRGEFLLKRPGRFRWNYTAPYEQDIIGDGRSVWVVDKDLEQVSQQSQDTALRGTPALLLVEGGDVGRHFEIVDLGEHQGMYWVELFPRDEEGPFERIHLAFADGTLQRMETRDRFGQISRLLFTNMHRNVSLDDQLFVYVPEDGTDLFTP